MPPRLKVTVERFGFRVFVRLTNLIYAILKLLPVQRKVMFTTWNADSPTLDFQVLADRLRHLPDPPTVVLLCRELRGGLVAHIVFGFHMLHQMYHMATSQVLVLDAYSVLASSLTHRPQLRVVQLWHALGAFKKFGWSIVDKSEGWSAQSNIPSRTLSRLLRMHAGYTDAVVSYSGAIPYFADAFHCDPSIFHIAWLPRVDLLRDDSFMASLRQRILAAHPELADKPVVLYAPTLRRSALDSWRVTSLVKAVDAAGWNLIVKPHPIRGESNDPIFEELSVPVPEFSAPELLAVADAVIPDYSAIVYEAYLRGTPVYFYAYDMEEYERARGFYTPPSAFPSNIYSTADALIHDLKARVGDPAALKAFVDIFLEDSDRRVDILDLISPDKVHSQD